ASLALLAGSCTLLLQGCLGHEAAPRKSTPCSEVGSHGRSMNCGPGVPLCGVLALETGKGGGV
ncbi:unnamed protein product, partial [Polarella glacialis]